MSFRAVWSTVVPMLLVSPLVGQALPTRQPPLIEVIRELEKPGHGAAHEATEARWAQTNRTAGFPAAYIALVAASGTPEVWWVVPYESFDGLGKTDAFGDAAYKAGIGKIAMEDGDHITNVIRMQARAVPDASHGAFPEVGKARVYSVITVRMRPGHEQSFTEIAKHFAAAAGTGVTGWRSYEVVAGAPGGTYLVMASYPSWAAVDANEAAWAKAAAGGAAHFQAATKLSAEAVMSTETRYFSINPRMSLVPKELSASDPFWAVKP